jgi:hypothetical protein
MNVRLTISLSAFLVLAIPASALVVPFNEEFATGNSNWLAGNSSAATWVATGGVDGGGYISAPGAITAAGFGTIVFRGNNTADASGDAFVGDWLAGGVTSFSAFVRHDAPVALNIFARLDAGSGRAGSSIDFSVPGGEWFQINVPIVDSPSSFQSFGAGTFNTVFSNIQNIQLVLSATQDPSTAGQTYTVDFDNVSVVPEPGTVGLVVFGLAGLALLQRRRARRKLA